MSSTPPISDDLVEFLASGVNLVIATRDAALMPEAVLGMGIRVHGDHRTVTAYVGDAIAGPTLANLRAEKRAPIALTLCHPPTERAVQLKGVCTGIRASTETDRELQAIFRSACVAALAYVGMPRPFSRGVPWWPSTAIEVEVHEVFKQTPGPDAGEPLRGGAKSLGGVIR